MKAVSQDTTTVHVTINMSKPHVHCLNTVYVNERLLRITDDILPEHGSPEVFRQAVYDHCVPISAAQWQELKRFEWRRGIIQSRRVISDDCCTKWCDLDEELGPRATLVALVCYLSVFYGRAPDLKLAPRLGGEYLIWEDYRHFQYRFSSVWEP